MKCIVLKNKTVIPLHRLLKRSDIMSENKVRKTVSFNITNPEDVKLLELIEDKNFSGYIKELLKEELQKIKK
jgi:hypothetical protein